MSFSRSINPRTVGRGAARGGRQPQRLAQTTPWQAPRDTSTQGQDHHYQVSDSAGNSGGAPSSCPSGGSCGDVEDRTESHRAYTVIPPNENKRRSILEKAKAEEDNYRRYKESQKMSYVSCGGTVGGASCAPSTSLRQKQRTSTFNSKKKSEKYREEVQREETTEINRKKMEQRRKAEMNERVEEERQERLRQEHKRVNSAFLRRLERR